MKLHQDAEYAFFNDDWPKAVPSEPGVYLIWNRQDELVYVGEASNLRARMQDIGRTYNHTCRRAVGKLEFSQHLQYQELKDNKSKYHPVLEEAITAFFSAELKISFEPISFGRLELEYYFIELRTPCYRPRYNSKTYKRAASARKADLAL